jgi:hypothetical protein
MNWRNRIRNERLLFVVVVGVVVEAVVVVCIVVDVYLLGYWMFHLSVVLFL